MRDWIVLTPLRFATLSLLAASSACSAPSGLTSFPVPTRTATGIRPGLQLAASTPVAVDPELAGFDGWPLVFVVVAAPAGTSCTIEVSRDGDAIASLPGTMGASACEATWTARAADGSRLPSGPVTATATLTNGGNVLTTSTADLALVRVGVTTIELGGAAGARQPLLYRATAGRRDGFFELRTTRAPFVMGPDSTEAGATALAHADGSPRAVPAIWEDLLSPPLDPGTSDGVNASFYSVPSAYVVGSELAVTAHTSTSDAIPDAIELRLVAPVDLAIEGDDVVHDGASITLSTLGSPIPAVDRYDLTWAFAFESRPAGGEWQPMPGTFPVHLRIYGLAGAPVFGYTTLPHRTWVDVIDRIAGWIHGAATTPNETAALLVQHVYEDTNLRYDTASGASFYTDYPGRGFESAIFYMQDFEERANGRIINCSDAASILSSYGSMAGVDLRYHILTNRISATAGFDLNFIRAIGMPAFDDTPFDSGRGGFRYHAIVGSPDDLSWDATLALDGDADPAASPFEMLLAQALDPDRYLRALSSEAANIRTDFDDKVRIQ
jgi:hypothetical protein